MRAYGHEKLVNVWSPRDGVFDSLHLTVTEIRLRIILCRVHFIWVLKQHARRRSIFGMTEFDDSALTTDSIGRTRKYQSRLWRVTSD